MSVAPWLSCLFIALVGCAGAQGQQAGQQARFYPQAALAVFGTPAPIGERVVMVDTAALRKLVIIDRVHGYDLADVAASAGRPLHASPTDLTFECVSQGGPCRLPGDPLVVTVLSASRGNGTAQIEVRYTYNIRFPDGTAVVSYDDIALQLRSQRDGWVLTEARRVSGH
jgi:hypothetical protein